MVNIFFPERLDKDSLYGFFEELDANLDTPEVCLDCSTLRYSFPTGMLVAGSKIRTWVRARHGNKLRTVKAGVNSEHSVHSYLSHLGFFDYILMGEGNAIGEASGSSSYLPITRIEKPVFNSNTQDVQEWYEEIMSVVRGLARIVSGTSSDTEENRLYNYALREIIRNVFEHSSASECYVCGQRWWDGKVEIAVIDEGIGIAESLKKSYHLQTDGEALHLAIKPGVSSTSNISQTENIYDNSGFGLYVLSQLASSFGWYVLGSGSSRIVGHSQTIVEEALNFNGTYFGMKLSNAPKQFSEILDDIIATGEKEAEASGISKKASGMSKLS
ncbi:ATP-binding protein [Dickeya chrysanthemi]|uniref:ATP-binding protein n=1 Tax=Dickeya chrysanthemi TaxID=556 RepID=UPI0003A6E1AE|nr:ATP-binding protein [Dickeya chrysanthemi]MBX9448149.1 sensor histidine kinase [Dickeya chrysanthemi]